MAKALYRKYRSKKLAEVIGQEHITTTLQNAIQKGQISHAYLLTGPRGVGKTSVARILAHEVNNLAYEDDSMHLDIIEIDAASNRRIDEVRDLREKVNLAPTSAKYKVYIIDEVHMLTREAFNALLKTLEEPPEHVIFILATTEIHKLPETIISRTQRFGFRPVKSEDITKHLRFIAGEEKIDIDDLALQAIAEHANGGFRDAISLLDQARGLGKKISVSDIEQLLGKAPKTALEKLLELIESDDRFGALQQVHDLLDEGFSPEIIASQLVAETRRRLLSNNMKDYNKLVQLCDQLLKVQESFNPLIALELTILRHTADEVIHNEKVTHKQEVTEAKAPAEAPKKPTTKPKPSSNVGIEEPELWPAFLEHIKGQHNTLYGILRMADVAIQGDKISLSFQFPFHMKRAAEAKHRTIIDKGLHEVSGKNYEVEFLKRKIETPKKSTKVKEGEEKGDVIKKVRDVFGDAEVI